MLTYLAGPYYHADQSVIDQRMQTMYQIDGYLSSNGYFIVTPLYKVETAKHYSIVDTFDFWEKYCYQLLDRCDQMIILDISGWKESKGVLAEIRYCMDHDIPVYVIDVDSKRLEPLYKVMYRDHQNGFVPASVDTPIVVKAWPTL